MFQISWIWSWMVSFFEVTARNCITPLGPCLCMCRALQCCSIFFHTDPTDLVISSLVTGGQSATLLQKGTIHLSRFLAVCLE